MQRLLMRALAAREQRKMQRHVCLGCSGSGSGSGGVWFGAGRTIEFVVDHSLQIHAALRLTVHLIRVIAVLALVPHIAAEKRMLGTVRKDTTAQEGQVEESRTAADACATARTVYEPSTLPTFGAL